MLRDQNLVRKLESCEIMGGATTICSDKTGTLTQNVMTVRRGILAGQPFASPAELAALPADAQAAIADAVAVNSTADLVMGPQGAVVLGNKTEGALLKMTAEMGQPDYVTVRRRFPPVHVSALGHHFALNNALPGDIVGDGARARDVLSAFEQSAGAKGRGRFLPLTKSGTSEPVVTWLS